MSHEPVPCALHYVTGWKGWLFGYLFGYLSMYEPNIVKFILGVRPINHRWLFSGPKESWEFAFPSK